jgi:hypothetical protein
MILSLAQRWFGIVCIVGLIWLHHKQSLANVTMATSVCNLLYGKNKIKAVMLPWKPELVVYCEAKRT